MQVHIFAIYFSKIITFDLKWVYMARYELVLRLDGALWLRIISGPLLIPKWPIQIPKWPIYFQQDLLLVNIVSSSGVYFPWRSIWLLFSEGLRKWAIFWKPQMDRSISSRQILKALSIPRLHQGWITARDGYWITEENRSLLFSFWMFFGPWRTLPEIAWNGAGKFFFQQTLPTLCATWICMLRISGNM